MSKLSRAQRHQQAEARVRLAEAALFPLAVDDPRFEPALADWRAAIAYRNKIEQAWRNGTPPPK